jgi:glycosyltransferase involved in cell wall biosynthesis
MIDSHPLSGTRVVAALNGVELFGHERGNIETFKALRDLGAEVVVAVNNWPENHVRDELARIGFPTFPLPFGTQWSITFFRKEPLLALGNLWSIVRCSWTFYSALRLHRATHVHLGSQLVYSYLSLALAASDVPVVYRMGDAPPLTSPANLWIWRRAMRRCTRIVANSNFILRMALTAGASAERLSLNHNVAPTGGAPSAASTGSAQVAADPFVLYVGAVSEHKGLLHLVDAFALVAKEQPLLGLRIVGGSRFDLEFRKKLQERVHSLGLGDRVIFHNHVADPSGFYRNALVHVAPTVIDEAFANVVLEAKRQGTPSVVFPSGGLAEMVNHKVDGYVCREKSTTALFEGLVWMLQDRERLMRMRTAAMCDTEARFSAARFSKAWADIYSAASRPTHRLSGAAVPESPIK